MTMTLLVRFQYLISAMGLIFYRRDLVFMVSLIHMGALRHALANLK